MMNKSGVIWEVCPENIEVTMCGDYVEGKFSIGDKPIELNKE